MSKTINQHIRSHLVAVLSLASLSIVPTIAGAQMVTLDEFDSRFVKRQFWDGVWTGRALDTSRSNSGGKLMLSMRGYGDLAESRGSESAGEGVSLNKKISSKWSRVDTRVRFTSVRMRDCADNSEPNRSRIRIFGRMFSNVVDPGTPSSDDKDKVIAYIALDQKSNETANRFRVNYWAALCKTSGCDTYEPVASGELGTVGLMQWAKLTMENDIENRQLIFGYNGARRSHDYSAVVPSPVTLNQPEIRFQLASNTPNCTASVRTRPFTDLKGEVDWVRINADALN